MRRSARLAGVGGVLVVAIGGVVGGVAQGANQRSSVQKATGSFHENNEYFSKSTGGSELSSLT